jgi:hypothetical protein
LFWEALRFGLRASHLAFYHLSHDPAIFALVIFQVGSWVFLARAGWPGLQSSYLGFLSSHTPSFFIQMSFTNFMPGLALNGNRNPPNLHFLSGWDYRSESTCPILMFVEGEGRQLGFERRSLCLLDRCSTTPPAHSYGFSCPIKVFSLHHVENGESRIC